MPTPMLKVRHISSARTPPTASSAVKSAGTSHASRSMRAAIPGGSIRGTLPSRPPPVMWARPRISTRERSSRIAGR